MNRKTSFSKIAAAAVFFISLAVIIYACWLMAYLKDASGLAYLIPSVVACLSTVLAFYFNKSKAENTKGGIVYDSAFNQGQRDTNGDSDEES